MSMYTTQLLNISSLHYDSTIDNDLIQCSIRRTSMIVISTCLPSCTHDSEEFAGERIPTLKEAIALCLELGLFVLLEIKSSTTDYDRVNCAA